MFSADGSRIVTASDDQTAALWDAVTGAELAVLRGHHGSVRSAMFSPDGTRVVTASDDKTARLWDARSGIELAVFNGHTAEVTSAMFSPDGSRIVTASRDNTARLWDLSDLEPGEAFEIACLRLGNNVDLKSVAKHYGLTGLKPICGGNAPVSIDWGKIQ
jgi:WD40 repeat protein